jgi:hypothetical protein
MYKPNPKPMELSRKSRLERTAAELEKMLSHLRSRPLPVFPNHGRRKPELQLCKLLAELALEAHDLADTEAYSDVGRGERYWRMSNFYGAVFGAKLEFFDHLKNLEEGFKLS